MRHVDDGGEPFLRCLPDRQLTDLAGRCRHVVVPPGRDYSRKARPPGRHPAGPMATAPWAGSTAGLGPEEQAELRRPVIGQ